MTHDELPYDFEDFGMTVQELEAKYGEKGHPEYTTAQWLSEPLRDDSPIGYWNWVKTQIALDDDEIPGHDINGDPLPEVQVSPIESVSDLAGLIFGWHQNRIQRLQQMMEIPEDAVVQYGDKEYTLAGDLLIAYQIGLTVAMSEFRRLPFYADVNEPETPLND